jgi:hypothetical protein
LATPFLPLRSIGSYRIREIIAYGNPALHIGFSGETSIVFPDRIFSLGIVGAYPEGRLGTCNDFSDHSFGLLSAYTVIGTPFPRFFQRVYRQLFYYGLDPLYTRATGRYCNGRIVIPYAYVYIVPRPGSGY